MSWKEWYDSLLKPAWTPEPATIGTIWQILYPIIIATFVFVMIQAIRKKVPWKVTVPFIINLAANLAFTPIQFGLRSLFFAAVDILVVWGTIIWMMIAIWKYYKWLAIAQVPYLVWVSIAAATSSTVTAVMHSF